MKKYFTIILFLGVFICGAETFFYVAPDFLHSFYESYSYNYLNAVSSGMGATGVARVGSVYNMIQNPASIFVDKQILYAEYFQKTESLELNEVNNKKYRNYGFTGGVYYANNVYKNLNLAFSAFTPNSLKYEKFSRLLEDGSHIVRTPKLLNFCYSFAGSYKYKKLHFGFAVILNKYIFKDYRYIVPRETENPLISEFRRIDFDKNVFRLQPGIIFDLNENISLGFSYIPKKKEKFDADIEFYETNLPSLIKLGLSVRRFDEIFNVDFDYEKTSEQSSMFDDRYRIKIGYEKDRKKYILRGGIIYVSNVFTGKYKMPVHENRRDINIGGSEVESDIDWMTEGKIANQSQFIVTFGFSKRFLFGNWHFSLMKDFKGSNLIQIMTGIETEFKIYSEFNSKYNED